MTHLHLEWSDLAAAKRFRTGVSLHSHTSLSKETLLFVPRHTQNVPVLSSGIKRLEARYRFYHDCDLDYRNVWWTPPLTPEEAFRLEAGQIQDKLGLPAFVSLSDHDDLEAGLQVKHLGGFPSVEWTVPMGPVFFHVGLHNVPEAMMPELRAVTADPQPARVQAILAALHDRPETLIVLNHPKWDEIRAGQDVHDQKLNEFFDLYRPWIHALELNGLRPWSENVEVRKLAESMGLPAISGGDRHGLEPNANVNVTDADTFGGFAEEVRVARRSQVVFLEQYRESMRLRTIRVMCDVLRDLPGSRWNDRIFYRSPSGVVRTLAQVMGDSAPGVVGQFLALVRLADRPTMQTTLRWALADRQRVVL